MYNSVFFFYNEKSLAFLVGDFFIMSGPDFFRVFIGPIALILPDCKIG